MSCNIEDNFPLAYQMMKDLYKTDTPSTKGWWGRVIPPTREDKYLWVISKLGQVKQPIWSLVEEILQGGYSLSPTKREEDYFHITVADQLFKVTNVYHMHKETFIVPDVTDSTVEHRLLRTALQTVLQYELHGKYRDKLRAHYKEENL